MTSSCREDTAFQQLWMNVETVRWYICTRSSSGPKQWQPYLRRSGICKNAKLMWVHISYVFWCTSPLIYFVKRDRIASEAIVAKYRYTGSWWLVWHQSSCPIDCISIINVPLRHKCKAICYQMHNWLSRQVLYQFCTFCNETHFPYI